MALAQGLPIGRLQSELFNAGRDWEEAFASAAVAAYATAAFRLYDTLGDRLRESGRPEETLRLVISEAKSRDGRALGGSPAVALAERALMGTLLRHTARDVALAKSSAAEAANIFESSRGTRASFLSDYVGELLSQYARHVTSREAGALTEPGRTPDKVGLKVSETRSLARNLAVAASEVGRQTDVGDVERLGRPDAWGALVHRAFATGRQLPVDEG